MVFALRRSPRLSMRLRLGNPLDSSLLSVVFPLIDLPLSVILFGISSIAGKTSESDEQSAARGELECETGSIGICINIASLGPDDMYPPLRVYPVSDPGLECGSRSGTRKELGFG